MTRPTKQTVTNAYNRGYEAGSFSAKEKTNFLEAEVKSLTNTEQQTKANVLRAMSEGLQAMAYVVRSFNRDL